MRLETFAPEVEVHQGRGRHRQGIGAEAFAIGHDGDQWRRLVLAHDGFNFARCRERHIPRQHEHSGLAPGGEVAAGLRHGARQATPLLVQGQRPEFTGQRGHRHLLTDEQHPRKTLATPEGRQQILQHDPCERRALGIGEHRAQALFRVGKGFDRNDDPHGLRPSPAQRQVEGISRFILTGIGAC